MSQSMLETIAIIIDPSGWGGNDSCTCIDCIAIRTTEKQVAIMIAKAVLETLKNLTPDLIEGVMQASLDCTPINRCEQQALQVWQNTINAIIEEKVF